MPVGMPDNISGDIPDWSNTANCSADTGRLK
jgi:hypothetical protein